jgi:hypothetical protein
MQRLGLFVGLHSIWYWAVQHFSHTTEILSVKELEDNVPPKRHYEYRQVISTFCINTLTLCHTTGLLALGFPKDATLLFDPTVGEPSAWITSQYAIEITVLLWGFYRNLWNPMERLRRDFFIHHALTLAMLAVSYATHYTTIGSLVITITNSTNLFFDYFKYGRLTGDVYTQWVSSALFLVLFFLARIHLLGATVIIPLIQHVLFLSVPADYIQVGVQLMMLLSLYGMQCLWFYKLLNYVGFQTKRLLVHPDILPRIPDRFIALLDAVHGGFGKTKHEWGSDNEDETPQANEAPENDINEGEESLEYTQALENAQLPEVAKLPEVAELPQDA